MLEEDPEQPDRERLLGWLKEQLDRHLADSRPADADVKADRGGQ